jgi:photosystem II stability/assembly factor-like uncharacterized protein
MTTARMALAGRAVAALVCGGTAGAQQPVLAPQASGVSVVLQAVSAPSARVAWVGGHGGVVLRTTDGGAQWTRIPAPGGDSLQFRDVHALDSARAWLLAAGPGERSRIYHTADGGAVWTPQFINRDSSAFFDCFAFWDDRRAVAFSDAVAGRWMILVTDDGGADWRRVLPDGLPPPQRGEGAFAASGTCVVAGAPANAWIATGAADTARVLRTTDGGRTWSLATAPVPGGATAGLTTLAFRDSRRGFALGGEVTGAGGRGPAAARTNDGGATWIAAESPVLAGAVYGAAFVPRTDLLVAVGPGGMAWWDAAGAAWAPLDSAAYWSVGFAPEGGVGWAVGPGGRITRISRQGSAGH